MILWLILNQILSVFEIILIWNHIYYYYLTSMKFLWENHLQIYNLLLHFCLTLFTITLQSAVILMLAVSVSHQVWSTLSIVCKDLNAVIAIRCWLSLSSLVQSSAAEKSERDLIEINVVSEQQDSLYHFLSNHQMQRDHLIEINIVSKQQDFLVLNIQKVWKSFSQTLFIISCLIIRCREIIQ